jgi:virulence-associated protein VagC
MDRVAGKAEVRTEGDHQTLVLPADVRLPGGPVNVALSDGVLTVSPSPASMAEWIADIDASAAGQFLESGWKESVDSMLDDHVDFDSGDDE